MPLCEKFYAIFFMAEISQNVYLHRPLINQFRINEREIAAVTNTEEKHQILKSNLADFNNKFSNNNFLNNNNLIDNRNTSENSSRREKTQHFYVSSPSHSIHAPQMNDIKVSLMKKF